LGGQCSTIYYREHSSMVRTMPRQHRSKEENYRGDSIGQDLLKFPV
jgi:hypothetical protein